MKILCYCSLNIYAVSLYNILYNIHTPAQICICVRVWLYMRVCVHTRMYVHMGTRVEISHAHIYIYVCVCVGECLFAILSAIFNPSSVFLYTIYITHCVITLLCTLMLYICDRSTPDLDEDDELNCNVNMEHVAIQFYQFSGCRPDRHYWN